MVLAYNPVDLGYNYFDRYGNSMTFAYETGQLLPFSFTTVSMYRRVFTVESYELASRGFICLGGTGLICATT